MDEGSDQTKWQWADQLPTPKVEGSTATFEGVAPGDGDLVINATATGFSYNVVLHEAPQEALHLPVTMQANDLVLKPSSDGSFELEDSKGTTIASGSAPSMWDSAGPGDATVSAPQDGANVSPVDLEVADAGADAKDVVLAPDQDFLEDPSTQYPVVVDPTVSSGNGTSGDMWVDNVDFTSAQSSSLELRSGTWDAGGHIARTYLKFDNVTAPIRDKKIVSAKLVLRNYQSASCTGGPVRVRRITEYFDSSTLRWGNQPATDANAYAEFVPAYGAANCAAADAIWNVTPMVQTWADNGATNKGLLLKSYDETSNTGYRKYRSVNWANQYNIDLKPRLDITYDTAPTFSGSLGVSPCPSPCSSDWRTTTTTTPTLSATATDAEGDSLTYSWAIRAEDTTAVLSSGSQTKASGVKATWTVPTGILADDKVYEFRTTVSDGTLETVSSWNVLAIDQATAPSAPTGTAVSPCTSPCSTFVTTSRTPVISATISDTDSSFVAADVQLRAQGQTTLLNSGTTEPVEQGNTAIYSVPAGAITTDGNYEFRVAANDGTSVVWGAWTPLTITNPGPTEPADFTISTCAAPCASWTTTSLTPTLTAANKTTTPATFTFEIRGQENLSQTSTPATVASAATASWTVPSGLLAAGGLYDVRAGSVGSNGTTTWTAWHPMDVDPTATDTATSHTLEGEAADDAGVTPAPGTDTGTASPYGSADVDALDSTATQDGYNARSVGMTDDSPDYSARGVSIPLKYAPKLTLHPDEQWFPLSASTFLGNSKLVWSHDDGCRDDGSFGYNVNKYDLASGVFAHWEATDGCDHFGTKWKSNEDVAPFANGGPSGNREGFALNLLDEFRDGNGLQGDEPVYYRYVAKSYLMYWFHYGYSFTDVRGPVNGHHEADWERIAIKLDPDTNAPRRVQYFHHYESCTLPWSSVPKSNTYHPSVWVARGAHGSYPAGNHNQDGYGGGVIDRMSGSGPVWWGTRNLKNVIAEPWYGYGGGWGAVGKFSYYTGPAGPSQFKGSKPSFATERCEFNN